MNIIKDKKKFFAMFVLALLFFKHLIKRLFRMKSPGLKTFKENYNSEFLLEITKEQYDDMQYFQTCQESYINNLYCDMLYEFNRDGMPKLSNFIASNSRSMEEFRFSNKEINILKECMDSNNKFNDYYSFRKLVNFMDDHNKKLKKIINK